MKFTINFEKKHFYFLSVLIAIFGLAIFVAAAFNPSAPTHPLEQITIGGNSIDSNTNGIIDNSDRLGGLTLAELQAQIDAQIASLGPYPPTISGDKVCNRLSGGTGDTVCAISGTHDICFLTKTRGFDKDDIDGFGCTISGSGSSWTLTAFGDDFEEIRCIARCMKW